MAPDGTRKRQLPPKVAAMKARKRQKLDTTVNGAPAKSRLEGPSSHPVRLEDLDWKEVSMPDRLDDYEGFFGLEEIDDVEVVKSVDDGKVSFRQKGSSNSKSKAKEALGANNGLRERPATEDEGDDELVEDEWAGFSEDESEAKNNAIDRTVHEKDGEQHNGQAEDDTDDETSSMCPGEIDGLGDIPFQGLLGDEALDEGTDTSAWSSLELSSETLTALSKLGFSRPTPIQAAAISQILAGHDVIGKASTGSGKTLAFGIPILERYLEPDRASGMEKTKDDPERHPPLALILSPTRELAHQLTAHLTTLCSSGNFDGPLIATVTGGLSLQKQQRLLAKADIIIGTPGRLWEVISEGHGMMKWLKKIKFLVVDEADRLLSEGHFKEAEEILNALDRVDEDDEASEPEAEAEADGEGRQTLVFSATFHKGLQQRLAGKGKPGGDLMDRKESMEYLLKKLNFREEKPKFIDVNPVSQMASGLKEGIVECAGTEKDLYLYALLLLHPNTRTLIFANSISAVRRLTPFLQLLNIPAQALHGTMPQKARLRAIERFSSTTETSHPPSGKTARGTDKQASKPPNHTVLIATDVAARGLDIPNVQLVIHYHLPRQADAYVHRSGRTARGGQNGASILLCAPEEAAGVRRLVAKVHADARTDAGKGRRGYFMRSLDVDRRVVARLKPRAALAKLIADAELAKEKKRAADDLLREAAEDLGVEYDSEELEAQDTGRRGRGKGRKKKEREAREIGREELRRMKGELKGLLGQRVNVGVSERYLTGGNVDVEALLRGEGGEFLGGVGGLGLE